MKVAVTNRNIIKLAAPIALALFIPQISFFTNTVFLGRYGEKELGINGVAGVFYLTLSMIGYGFSNGTQIQMARRAGEGDEPGLTRIFANGMMLAVFLSLVLMLLSLWMAPVIFGLNLSDNENILLSINFIFTRIWGLPFLMLTQLVNAFFIATGRSKYLIFGSASAMLVTIFLDYMLIFGNGGFLRMGLNGAATASVSAEIVYCCVMYGIFYFSRNYRRYPVQRFWRFDFELSRRSLRTSAPLIVQYLFSIGGWLIFFIFVEHLGDRELAASQMLRSILGIIGIISWAFAATCNTMVSNIIGQNKAEEVWTLVKKIGTLSLGCTAFVGLFILSFADFFLLLYRNDPNLVAFAMSSLVVIVFATMLMSVATVVFNGVVGTGKTVINLLIEISCVLVYLVYCYIVIERHRMSLQWAWGSELIYWITLLLIATIYLRSGRWRGTRV